MDRTLKDIKIISLLNMLFIIANIPALIKLFNTGEPIRAAVFLFLNCCYGVAAVLFYRCKILGWILLVLVYFNDFLRIKILPLILDILPFNIEIVIVKDFISIDLIGGFMLILVLMKYRRKN